jgi:hypothetical protein
MNPKYINRIPMVDGPDCQPYAPAAAAKIKSGSNDFLSDISGDTEGLRSRCDSKPALDREIESF